MTLFRHNRSASFGALVQWMAFALLPILAAAPAAAQNAWTTQATSPAELAKTTSTTGADNFTGVAGPVRLQQPPNGFGSEPIEAAASPLPYEAGEFEHYVRALSGREQLRRFGSELMTDSERAGARNDPLPVIPGEYVIKPGDEIRLSLWGSVEADLRLQVDRSGRITVPRVGAIQIAGVRNAELADTISRKVALIFKNFQLNASLGQLRPIRVFVTGYVRKPGSMTLSGLSSVLHVLMRAGGPSAAGSFRDITLRRGGQTVANFDLYDLLLRADRGADQLVQPDDVIHIGPIGSLVALIGSVNLPAVFELKPNESLGQLLGMGGGFSPVADRTRVAVEQLADRQTGRVAEWPLPQFLPKALSSGDVVRVFSAVTATLPVERQKKRVRIDGEVLRPGDYILPPGSTLRDAVLAAGGLTNQAYLFGVEFTRESVRQTQQTNYERALRDLETDMARSQAGRRSTSAEDTTLQNSSAAANARLIERLRQVRPTGRVVLQIEPNAVELPELLMEDNDRLTVPTQLSSVGVFGSVFNSGSYLYKPQRNAESYLNLAGGPTRGADQSSIFLIRANGSVISARQGDSFWQRKNAVISADILPGDTIFVPEEMDKSTLTQNLKDWTQILYQFGLGIAGVRSLGL